MINHFPYVSRSGVKIGDTFKRYIDFLKAFPDASLAPSTSRKLSTKPTDIMRVRRSSDNAESDFNANEVKNGTLLDYVVPSDVQALYDTTKMYFDGVDDQVVFDNFDQRNATFRLTFMYSSGEQQLFQNEDASGSNRTFAATINTTLNGNDDLIIGVKERNGLVSFEDKLAWQDLEVGNLYTLVVVFNSSGNGFVSATLGGVSGSAPNGDSRFQGTSPATNTFYLGIRQGGGFPYSGTIYNFEVDGVLQVQGYGNTNAEWEDQIGTNDGTVNGNPQILGKRMYFDGTDDYVEFGSIPVTDMSTDFTMTAKIVSNDHSSEQAILSVGSLGGNGLEIGIATNSNIYVRRGGAGTRTTNLTVPKGEESFIALTGKSGNYDVYLNTNSETETDSIINPDTAAGIGGRSSGFNGAMFTGSIYDVRFFDGKVNSSEIQSIIDDDIASVSASQTLHYKGHGNTNADWTDQIGSNDGTVNGSPALFTGQGFNGLVPTWYDQRVPTSVDRMYFDGVDDYVELNNIPLGDDFDIETTVVYKTKGSGKITMFSSDNSFTSDTGFYFFMNADASHRFEYREGENTEIKHWANNFNAGDVIKLRLVKNGTDLTLYANESSLGTKTLSNSNVPYSGSTGTVHLGKRSDFAGENYMGTIYNVSFNNNGGLPYTHSYLGYGNTNADWTDQIGTNDGTVNGNPQRYKLDTDTVSRDFTQTTAANQPRGLLDGSVVTQNGKPMLDFDGTDDCLSIPASEFITPTTALQGSFVVRNNNADIVNIRDTIFSQWNSDTGEGMVLFDILTTEKLRCVIGSSDGTGFTIEESSSAITTNELQVVAFKYDAGTVTLYKNGTALASSNEAHDSTLYDSAASWRIGGRDDEPADTFWDGQIGEVYVSDTLDDDIVKIQQDQMRRFNIS